MLLSKRRDHTFKTLVCLYRNCDFEAIVVQRIMGFLGELVPLGVVLCLTVDGGINGGRSKVVGHVGDAIQVTKGDGRSNGGRSQAFGNGDNIQCGEQEHTAFLDCVFPYLSSFLPLTRGSSCNVKLITVDLCKKFAIIVRCVNDINASSTCRRDAVTQIRQEMNFACKLNDLEETCTEAPTLDTGETIRTTTSSSKRGNPVTGSAVVSRVSSVLLMIYKIMLALLLQNY